MQFSANDMANDFAVYIRSPMSEVVQTTNAKWKIRSTLLVAIWLESVQQIENSSSENWFFAEWVLDMEAFAKWIEIKNHFIEYFIDPFSSQNWFSLPNQRFFLGNHIHIYMYVTVLWIWKSNCTAAFIKFSQNFWIFWVVIRLPFFVETRHRVRSVDFRSI